MKRFLTLTIIIVTPLFFTSCTGKPYSTHVLTLPTPTIDHPTETEIPKKAEENLALGTAIKHEEITIATPPIVAQRPSPKAIKKRPNHQNGLGKGTTLLSKVAKLPKKIKESSGLIKVDGQLWTLNDSGGKSKLYQIDEKSGKIIKSIKIRGAYNRDWEALTYDDNYVYIGDVGNNKGYRRDLKIYKIPRKALKNKKSVRAEIIHFKYSDQKSFKKLHSRQTNFDCEAMVAYHGKLYLFSKDWGDEKTRLYELSTQTGKQIAYYKDSFNIQGLVTDASVNKKLDILLLSTYSEFLNVTVWAFSNYPKENFFKGLSKKLTLNALSAQVEGITFIDNYKAYMSSEAFSKYIFSFDSALYKIDFSSEFH